MPDLNPTDLKTKILSSVAADIVAIETALSANLNPYFDLVSQVAGHILFSGGKRMRPLLMVLSARLCGHDTPNVAKVSVIFEYLHAASLLHDDVIDEADMRRGRPVAHQVWNAATAVLTGDFLMARALSIAANTGLLEMISVVSDITEHMSQGEIQQLARKGDITLTEADYMDVIRYKTAVLFQGACHTGGLLAGASPQQCEALTTYGRHLGIAFQMADDLLDYTQDLETLGKRAGADLREGKMTLPLIHALSNASADDYRWIADLIKKPDFSNAEFSGLVDRLRHYNGIAYTRERMEFHVHTAKTALGQFPDSSVRNILQMLADYARNRQT